MKNKNKFYILFSTVLVLIVLNQSFIQYFLHTKKDEALLINIAGQQRMLSQRVNQLSYRSIKFGGRYYQDLQHSLVDWQSSHLRIMNGDDFISKTKNKEIKEKLRYTYNIILSVDSILTNAKVIDTFVLVALNKKVDAFLPVMNDIVGDFEAEADQKLNYIILLELFFSMITIIVIFIEFRLIIKPSFDKILEQNNALKKIAWHQSHDLRRPVANILGLIRMLRASPEIKSEENVKTLNYLQDSAEQLENTIDVVVEKSDAVREVED
ncbi:hypothetical protein DNU06_01640 [Putridiphycobacter roseus]|uniref:histidine kinase n=1 Tax=Putridiphycobacter roseus TaxID=2219161 RepID=A0A2W1N5X2_9FLAO|nr:type IV pili methyl-accepting chemotaxis transducer N-terminal domain-containing protein [Putridiphycobacter roseus]PZE18561.1 hypothetical protein DNU06_01640 [Putridiphycobacter roseus]